MQGQDHQPRLTMTPAIDSKIHQTQTLLGLRASAGRPVLRKLTAAVITLSLATSFQTANAQDKRNCTNIASWTAAACSRDLEATSVVVSGIERQLSELPTCSTLKPAQEANCAAKRSTLASKLAEARAVLTNADAKRSKNAKKSAR